MKLAAFTAIAACVWTACINSLYAEGSPSRAPELEQIADDVWIHKSWIEMAPYGLVLSQGLVVDNGTAVTLVDTAWTDEDTATLLLAIEELTGKAPEIAVITHAHSDKMGGVPALDRAGVASMAYELTNEDAMGRGLRAAGKSLRGPLLTAWPVGEGEQDAPEDNGLVVFYPGPGHTRDNVVVYYPAEKILFGGCLIRPGAATNLGNTADADIKRWAASVRAVAAQFPDAEVVIPSHGPAGGRELLDHTIALATAANE